MQGFAATLDAIVQNLPSPPQRQTLLFSATQTKSVCQAPLTGMLR